MFKSGFVSIIGRPNVGKSTLINNLMGQKFSIVSNKPQTTRNNIKMILNGDDYQIIILDTPGIHKPHHKLGEYMVKVASEAIKNVEIIMFITTPDKTIGKGDMYILEQLKSSKVPVFLILNKIDIYKPENIAETIKNYTEYFNFAEVIPISAFKSKNVDVLLDLMVKYMPEGPMYYPKDMVTDEQERFFVKEIIREKALRFLNDEVPHGIGVEIVEMKENKNGAYNISANIICEKESHKGIVIGKNGKMLHKITQRAKRNIEDFLNKKVKLVIWVKVRKKWRDNPLYLRQLGYKKN